MRLTALVRGALAVTFGVAVAGCGGSPSTSSSSSTPTPTASTPTPAPHIASVNACSLVSADQAGQAFGATFVGSGAAGLCTYGGSNGTQLLIFAQVQPNASAADAIQPDAVAKSFNGAYGISNPKTLSGIGDKALEYTLSSNLGGGTVVFVVKANVILLVIVQPAPADTTNLEMLAKTAADGVHA